MTVISERQCARFYIYKKQNNCQTFLYTKIQTLCKKQDSFPFVFMYKMQGTLLYAIFHENVEIGFYIKKYDTLRYVTFYI